MPQFCNLESAMYQGVGKYGIPEIEPVYECDVNKWLSFNYIKAYETKADRTTGCHFFIYDYQFERAWNTPDKYLNHLSRYGCVLSPDFSAFPDFPFAVNIFNHYRKHWLARYWQEHGITVIPTVRWGDESSFEWCFDGEPRNSIIATSEVGCVQNKEDLAGFRRGYNKMLEILNPTKILLYTNKVDKDYGGNVTYIRWGRRMPEGEL